MIGSSLNSDSDLTLDLIQPFQLELANVRGRALRLNRVLDDVLRRHDYPPPVEHVVAEAIAATALLASLLRYDGVFTLQAKGDGAVPLLVVDVTTGGDVRAYARFDPDRISALDGGGARNLLGEGYLAFTVDQGDKSEGYQGIVALVGDTLSDSVAHYFEQSEQLPTTARLSARHYPDGWRAGAILIQRLPENDAGRVVKPLTEEDEDWRRANILLNTVADVELLDRTLHLNDLVFRLFHEEQIRVFTPSAVQRGCRCSAERVERVLRSIPIEELEDLKVEGEIVVTCEFCGTEYRSSDGLNVAERSYDKISARK